MEPKIRISQCMIVKNEEGNIERALLWGKGIVSEQIVVDTGSTDRTVEIAEKMGAKVYHFPWIDDFAAAKNFAIDKARYEWIAFLDADEYFLEKDAKEILYCIRQVHNTNHHGIATGWIHLDDKGGVLSADTQIRIFRNLPALRYKRKIHEYLVLDDVPIRTADAVSVLSIYHTGYGEKTVREKKGRNLKLIEAELQIDPNDWELWGYLGNEYDGDKDCEQAARAYRKAISLMPEDPKGHIGSIAMIYMRYLQLLTFLPEPDEKEIMEVYQKAVKSVPEEGDFDYMVGQYFTARKDWKRGETHIRRALTILEANGNAGWSAILSGNIMKTYEMLAICCYSNGNLKEYIKLTSTLLKENPYLMSTLVVMLAGFSSDQATTKNGMEGAVQVAAFLGKSFYRFDSLKDRIFVLRAAMASGYQDLTAVMRNTFTQEELNAVDKALNQKE